MKTGPHTPRHATVVILALRLGMLLAPADAHSKVYFTAFVPEGTGIERAGFDGSRQQTLQSEPAGFEDGLALDTAGGRMYWTDTNASIVASANLNGTDSQ